MNKPAPGSDQFYLIIFPAVPAGGWNLETIILLALGHATLPGACKGGGIRVGATGGLGARSGSDWAWCTLAVPLLALVVGWTLVLRGTGLLVTGRILSLSIRNVQADTAELGHLRRDLVQGDDVLA
jgi:hypothetical protein